MLYLVDTSAWIEFFRVSSPFELETVASIEETVTCLPIIQEVLQGFDDERAFQTAREALFALQIVEDPLSAEVYEEAAHLYRAARRRGITIRSGVDCLIAVCALRNSLTVLHQDRDFTALAQVAPLQEHDIGSA